jgi:hypothetical protein
MPPIAVALMASPRFVVVSPSTAWIRYRRPLHHLDASPPPATRTLRHECDRFIAPPAKEGCGRFFVASPPREGTAASSLSHQPRTSSTTCSSNSCPSTHRATTHSSSMPSPTFGTAMSSAASSRHRPRRGTTASSRRQPGRGCSCQGGAVEEP